jgi:hypothetical protein
LDCSGQWWPIRFEPEGARNRRCSTHQQSVMKCDICDIECFDHGTLKCDCDYSDECADRVLSERWIRYFKGEDSESLPSGVEWLINEVFKRLKGKCNPVTVIKHCEWYYENWGKNGV